MAPQIPQLSLPADHLVGNFTRIPNYMFDHVLPAVGARHFAVLMTIIRNTHGRQQEWDYLSHEQIATACGTSETTVKRSISWLERMQYISVAHSTNRTKNSYAVRWDVVADHCQNPKVQNGPIAASENKKVQSGPINGFKMDPSKVHNGPIDGSNLIPYKDNKEINKDTQRQAADSANEVRTPTLSAAPIPPEMTFSEWRTGEKPPVDACEPVDENCDPFTEKPIGHTLTGPKEGVDSAALPPLSREEYLDENIPTGSWLDAPTDQESELESDAWTGQDGDTLLAYEEAIADSDDPFMADPQIQTSEDIPGAEMTGAIDRAGSTHPVIPPIPGAGPFPNSSAWEMTVAEYEQVKQEYAARHMARANVCSPFSTSDAVSEGPDCGYRSATVPTASQHGAVRIEQLRNVG